MQYPESVASVEQTGMATVREYALIVSRNRWIIASAVALSLMVAYGYLLFAPQYYQSQALIMMADSGKGLESVIKDTEAEEKHFEQRLFLIQKQITSMDFMGAIAKELSTSSDNSGGEGGIASWGALARWTRVERAMIDPAGGKGSQNLVNGFVVSYLHQDPKTAMDVATRIADKFIKENEKEREEEVEGTGQFLEEELRSIKRELEKKEEIISNFKKSHVGGLPSQAETNMHFLDRAEADITKTTEDLQRHSEKLAC